MELDIIESQVRQIFASIVWNHKIHEKASDIESDKYDRLELLFMFASVFTTAGLVSILLIDEFYVKLISTILSSIVLFRNTFYKVYNLCELRDQHKKTALDFLELRGETISLLVDIKIKRLNEDVILEKRDEIQKKFHDICKRSLPTSEKAVGKAHKALKIQRDNTFSDEEIDSYLPIELRKGEIND